MSMHQLMAGFIIQHVHDKEVMGGRGESETVNVTAYVLYIYIYVYICSLICICMYGHFTLTVGRYDTSRKNERSHGEMLQIVSTVHSLFSSWKSP